MIKVHFFAGLALVCLATGVHQLPAAGEPATRIVQQDASPDEMAIRANSKASAMAFNAGDAKAVAARWTEDGDYVNQEGQRYTGRAAIQKEYENFFAQYPGIKINYEIDSIRVLSPETAIVEGTATVGSASTPSPVSSKFVTVQVKRDGNWLIASARDVRTVVATNIDRIADFEKLIGKWVYQDGSTKVTTTCRWIGDKKFIERKYSVSNDGVVASSGTQIIGWNPVEQQITSWLFDSTGAHGFATWSPRKDGWASQSNGFTADGEPTSATYVLTHTSQDALTWKSTNRTMGDRQIPDTAELVLKRVSN